MIYVWFKFWGNCKDNCDFGGPVGFPIEVGGTWAAKNEYLLRTKMAESHR